MRFLSLSGRPLVGVLALALGCATVATRDDYADYREVRLADDDDARRRAVSSYLESHPEGQWAGELRAEHEAAEDALYEERKSTAEGLRYYLEVYPEGRYADQAQARLTALESVRQNRQREADIDRDVHRERREEALAERREWASQAISFWTRILLEVERWGEPIGDVAAANEDFDDAFRGAPPARCSNSECIKYYHLDFAVPVPGQTRIERAIELVLRLRFEGDDRRLVHFENARNAAHLIGQLRPGRAQHHWHVGGNLRRIRIERMRGEAVPIQHGREARIEAAKHFTLCCRQRIDRHILQLDRITHRDLKLFQKRIGKLVSGFERLDA